MPLKKHGRDARATIPVAESARQSRHPTGFTRDGAEESPGSTGHGAR